MQGTSGRRAAGEDTNCDGGAAAAGSTVAGGAEEARGTWRAARQEARLDAEWETGSGARPGPARDIHRPQRGYPPVMCTNTVTVLLRHEAPRPYVKRYNKMKITLDFHVMDHLA